MLTVNATLVAQQQNEEMKNLAEAANVQNEEVKKISAWAAILFAPTLIGTIYGMNFEHMPELGWASATRSRSSSWRHQRHPLHRLQATRLDLTCSVSDEEPGDRLVAAAFDGEDLELVDRVGLDPRPSISGSNICTRTLTGADTARG